MIIPRSGLSFTWYIIHMKRGDLHMNDSYFDTIYIGYLYYPGMENILLCVSEDRYKVEYYIQEIRGLSRKMVDIRKVTLNLETAESLYGNFMLESYIEPYNYLTICLQIDIC